jgi:coenzyme F420-reducing hydrogenase delta subunit
MENSSTSSGEFEPIILGFACNWCGYAAADQAGMAKIQYPTNIKLARIMCLGTVDPSLVMNAFDKGFDGVILIGCHIGECHYVSGNKNAVLVVERIKELLQMIGLQEGRLRIEEVSAGEAPKFARVVKEFIQELKVLGPSPLRKTEIAVG